MPIRLGSLKEIISHSDLSDMPDTGGTNTNHDTRYLKLDQSIAQTVINGAPTFNEGLIIPAGKKIYFDG